MQTAKKLCSRSCEIPSLALGMMTDSLPVLDPLGGGSTGIVGRTPKIKCRIVTSRCCVASGIEHWVFRSGIAVKIPKWITNSHDILGCIFWGKHVRFEIKVGLARGDLGANTGCDSCQLLI